MSTIPKYILNRNGGGGGGGGRLNPEDLKTVGYDSLIKEGPSPVVNVDFLYQQAEQDYPGGYLRVGRQRVPMRTINGEPIVGNTDIVITPGDANMVAITWADLKYLRDYNQLVPGTWYRIKNYSCTTSAPGTNSAGNNFDIIVLATSTWHLDENAFAVQNANDAYDAYFANCKLDAWRLKYCLDNDTSRFGWAQDDGRGVIYWMRDEWGNEAPYDFKNIRFARWAVTDLTSNSITIEELESLKGFFVYNDKDNPFFFGLQDTDYTQGGLTFHIDNKTKPAYYYTFGGDTDRSLNGGANGCYGNVIKPWIDSLGVQQLNNGVWVKTDGGEKQIHHSTTCGNNCHDWTCGNDCHDWTCGNGCFGWTCGNDCHDWTCGNGCFGWTCGNNCCYWTCGNGCFGWTCGNECFGWTCGNNCFGWTCGKNFRYFHLLSGTTGILTNVITPITTYSQYVGFDSQGTLRSLNIFD